MKRLMLIFISMLCMCIVSCNKSKRQIHEDVQQILGDYYRRNDFSGSFWAGDSCESLITTCLSVMLYDFGNVRYLTIVCFQYPVDLLENTEYDAKQKMEYPTCYYQINGIDVFVFNHTNQDDNILFEFSEKSAEKYHEMKDRYDNKNELIFETMHPETYVYNIKGNKILFSKNTIPDNIMSSHI